MSGTTTAVHGRCSTLAIHDPQLAIHDPQLAIHDPQLAITVMMPDAD